MLGVADALGISHDRVFATGSNKSKIEKIKELGIKKHIDNNQDVIDALGSVGEKFAFPEGTCWEGYEPYGTKIVDGREVPNCVPIKATEDFITEYIPYDDIAEQYCNCDYGYTAIGFKIGDVSEYRCVEENSQEAIDYNAAQLVMKLEALLKEMDKSMS